MKKKEFIEHYNNILNCPIEKYPENLDYLKNEVQQLADIDKISYPSALDKIYSVFFNQYFDADPDDNNFREIKTATVNLSFLRLFEGDVQQRRLREEY